MNGDLEGSLVYLPSSRDDLLSFIHLLSTQIGDPDSLFTPVQSFQVAIERSGFRVDVITSGHYQPLREIPPQEISITHLCRVIGNTLRFAVKCEAQLDANLSTISLCFSSDFLDIRTCLVSKEEDCLDIVNLTRELLGKGRAGLCHPPALANLIEQLGSLSHSESTHAICEWWSEACLLAARKCTSHLSSFIQQEDWRAVADILDWCFSAASVQFTICMNSKCEGKKRNPELEWSCARHFFCSEQCKNAVSSGPECSLCVSRRVIVRPRRQEAPTAPVLRICHCGKQFSEGNDEWRLSLIGSSQYIPALKCCSETCFNQQFPKRLEESHVKVADDDYLLCLECKRPLDDKLWWRFPCNFHGFCSSKCYMRFRKSYCMEEFSMFGPCLFCTRELIDLIPEGRDCYQPLLEQIEMEQQNVRSHPRPEVVRDLMLLYAETKQLIVERKDPKDTRPLYLSINQLFSSTWLMTCCVCRHSTAVHHFIPSLPCLVRCEYKVHCVCSYECYEKLGSDCPLCSDSKLIPIEDAEDATLEVLRAIPITFCLCRKSISFCDLLECAHSICVQCLASDLTDEWRGYDGWYSCPICSTKYTKDSLMSEVLG